MEKLSISEFRRCCNDIAAKSYQFSTSNQKDACPYFEYCATFDSMLICLSPNVIVFSNNNCRLILKCVRYIIHRQSEYLGHIFDIMCDAGNCMTACRMVVN